MNEKLFNVKLTLNNFSFINQIKFDHQWCEIMLQQFNVVIVKLS